MNLLYLTDQQRNMGSQGSLHAPFRLHAEGSSGGDDSRGPGSLKSSAHSSPSRQIHQQQQHPNYSSPPPQTYPPRQQKSPSPTRQSSVTHAPVAAPPPDDMEPQNVYFIEDQNSEDNLGDMNNKLKRMSISSGNRTYRITNDNTSPTRPSIGTKTFRVPTKKGKPVHDDADLPQPSLVNRSFSPAYASDELDDDENEDIKAKPLQDGVSADKGFYISFDDGETPKKPKPPLRSKKMTARKTSAPSTPLTTPNREESPFIPVRSYIFNFNYKFCNIVFLVHECYFNIFID